MFAHALTPRTRRILLGGLAGWFVLVLFVLTLSPASVSSIEARLQANAEAALACTERDRGRCVPHDWAQVQVTGQTARLTGAAPNDLTRRDALSRVAGSSWTGGVVAGGITRVIDQTTDARRESGFSFRADAANSQVFIRGDASDAAARDAIDSFASGNFSSGAVTDLTLIPGGAPDANWDDAAMRLLGQLARLDRGAVTLDGELAALVGEAANPQIAQSISTELAAMPEPYRAASIITPAGAPALVNVPDRAACASVVRAAQGANLLRFDRDRASLSPLSVVTLRRIANAVINCPETARLAMTINVEGDAVELAQDRARAVQMLLAEGGVDEERLDISLESDQLRAVTFSVPANEE